ncbi:MAG: F0F1 ATP synthase subunit B [Bacteroidetes bacterium]|jgi:F-type H+-transporting ATPase subunit b|nr:F0F1 ATP synthase subunit B [Bacteroidota bacterium]
MILGSLIEPGLGLIVWTTITFVLLLVILAKFAWKPILNAVKERETSIENALQAAEKAKLEMAELKAGNEKILNEARAERDALLKEARDLKEGIINEAKTKATKEAERILQGAREQIVNEKNAAITDLKNQVATLSIDIAEKILKTELSNDDKQKALVGNLMKDVNLN